MAEIKAIPYTGGNGPGGFSAAALSGLADDSSPGGILFTGFGPHLHEMGFKNNMMITEVDGVGVVEIFADRWRVLRLKDPSAYDAAHYKELTIDVNVSITSLIEAQYEPNTEVWQLNFQR